MSNKNSQGRHIQTLVPSTEIDIVTEAMTKPVDFLLKGEIDLAVVNAMIAVNGVKFEKLFDDEQVALVPSGHPDRFRKPLPLELSEQ